MSRHSQLKSTKPLSRRGGRRLRCELLESRMLLAGDTYLINFQFDEAPTPTRYLRDVGAVFGDRGNGLSYGWSSDHTDVSRDRNVNLDQRLDTLIHFHQNQIWSWPFPTVCTRSRLRLEIPRTAALTRSMSKGPTIGATSRWFR